MCTFVSKLGFLVLGWTFQREILRLKYVMEERVGGGILHSPAEGPELGRSMGPRITRFSSQTGVLD